MSTEPIHIISLGAGVQSSTMALMAAAGEIAPMPRGAIFADTQAEPGKVYKWLDWLEKQLPFPIHRVSKGSLTEAITTLREREDGKGHWVFSGIPTFNVNPNGSDGHLPRQCTYSFKIDELDREQKRIVGDERMREWRTLHKAALKELSRWNAVCRVARRDKQKPPQKPLAAWQECQLDPLCVVWIGISLDEVIRMKPSRHPWAIHRWPLIELRKTRHNCLLWMQSHGFPVPPRSACVYRPYHSDAEWRRMRAEDPADFAEAVRVDHEFRRLKAMAGLKGVPYIHDSRKPLDQVDFSTDEDHGQQVMFGNECEGMCGV